MSKYAILFIDADKKFAKKIAKYLPIENVKYKYAEDGTTGLNMAQRGALLAIVLDADLPGMSGYSVCNKLKGNKATRDIPLIMTSSEATPDTFKQHQKLRTRAQAYVLKGHPATDAQIRSAIQQLATGMEEGSAGLDALDDKSDSDSDLSGDELTYESSTAGHRCRCGATDWLQTTTSHLGLSSLAYGDRVNAFVCTQCGAIDFVMRDPASLQVDDHLVRRVTR